MVYETVKKVGSDVYNAGVKTYNTVTQGLPWYAKFGLIAGVVGIGGYITYYAVSNVLGAPGGSCSNPGSPCYQALQPYKQQYQTCANAYQNYLSQFLQEDSKNGTGFTSAQLEVLQQEQNCMDNAAANIAKIAHQYEPNYWQTLATDIGLAVVASATAYYGLKGAGAFIRQLRTPPTTGGSAGADMMNANVRAGVTNGDISPESAAGFSRSIQVDVQPYYVNDINTEITVDYVNLDILTTAEADDLSTVMTDDVTEDFADTLGLLE